VIIYTLRIPASPALLEAWSLRELAELLDCALETGDRIDTLLAIDSHRWRPLTKAENAQLLSLLCTR